MKKFIIILIVIIVAAFFINLLVQNRGSLNNQITDLGNNLGVPPAGSLDAETSPDNQKTMTATLHTSKGNITIEFLESQAPKTVANFLKLAKSGFYDKVKFHRVIKGFMIQGGDPLTKDNAKKDMWGAGGPGYSFDDEISENNSNVAGAVAMANSGPNTNGSQFFINAVDNHFLDSNYTVFGMVTAGMDIVTEINNVPTDSKDRPVDPVIIESISLQ